MNVMTLFLILMGILAWWLVKDPVRLCWNRFLLRFRWRHQQLGCARRIGTSVCGEEMWRCDLHGKDAL